jgi:uncharacterized membrane protein
MLEFFGRFHPVFVHLPIGILLLACTFIILSLTVKFSNLKPAIPFILCLGAISAVFSCLTGCFLANSGEYEGKHVSTHQWMGIAVAVLAIILWVIYKQLKSNWILGGFSGLLIVLISITGHLGGSLTHGADYLTSALKNGSAKAGPAIPAISNIQEAYVYQQAIQPLFQNRCYSCHGSEKQKGKLRLDEESYIIKGGKDGHTVVKGKADESELIKRLLLPLSSDEHMAPKEKPQLTENEIKLLKWWIDNGAGFKKKFKELPQPEDLKLVLASLEKGQSAEGELKISEIPTAEVAAVDHKVIEKFTALGIMVIPVAQNTNYLSANFINAESMGKEVVELIKSIEKQLIWIKMENSLVNDQTLSAIKNCKKLTRLSLNYTSITDNGLTSLKDLDQVNSLSLVGTKITAKGLNQLKKLTNLKHLYLYHTSITKTDLAGIKKIWPKISLDTGNYKLAKIASDTIEFKAP